MMYRVTRYFLDDILSPDKRALRAELRSSDGSQGCPGGWCVIKMEQNYQTIKEGEEEEGEGGKGDREEEVESVFTRESNKGRRYRWSITVTGLNRDMHGEGSVGG